MTGRIVNLNLERGFGFVRPDDFTCTGGRRLFMHAKELRGLEWNEDLHWRRITFEMQETDKGYRTVNVLAEN